MADGKMCVARAEEWGLLAGGYVQSFIHFILSIHLQVAELEEVGAADAGPACLAWS